MALAGTRERAASEPRVAFVPRGFAGGWPVPDEPAVLITNRSDKCSTISPAAVRSS